MSYDVQCGELARVFLTDAVKPDDPRFEQAVTEMAEDIQDAVEEFLRIRLCDTCARIMSAREAIHASCRQCREQRATPGPVA